jgi:hypothetical protein
MLPDLAAIARVRLARPAGEMGAGVAFHHACDEAFHESAWFRSHNVELRDALVAAGVDRGAARACSHAGVEMLLDGAAMGDARVAESAQRALDAVDADAAQLAELAPADARPLLCERLHLIGRTLDPRRYAEPRFVAERLHRMTAGRRRIELPLRQVVVVADALARVQPRIAGDADGVMREVRGRVEPDAVYANPSDSSAWSR